MRLVSRMPQCGATTVAGAANELHPPHWRCWRFAEFLEAAVIDILRRHGPEVPSSLRLFVVGTPLSDHLESHSQTGVTKKNR